MAIIRELSPFDRGASIDYLLGRNRRSAKPDYRVPRVLTGDPDRFERVVATIPFKKPFTALIVSFQEALDDRRLTAHGDSLVDALCAGLPRTQFEVLAVGHREKAAKGAPLGAPTWRSGLHLNLGNLHLPTGKCLDPFYYAQDQLYAALCLEILNIENGYSSGRACGPRAAVRFLDDPAEKFFPGGKLPPPEARAVGGEWHQRLRRGFAERRAARAAHHERLFGSPRRGCIHPTTVAWSFENTVSLSHLSINQPTRPPHEPTNSPHQSAAVVELRAEQADECSPEPAAAFGRTVARLRSRIEIDLRRCQRLREGARDLKSQQLELLFRAFNVSAEAGKRADQVHCCASGVGGVGRKLHYALNELERTLGAIRAAEPDAERRMPALPDGSAAISGEVAAAALGVRRDDAGILRDPPRSPDAEVADRSPGGSIQPLVTSAVAPGHPNLTAIKTPPRGHAPPKGIEWS